MNMHIDHYNNAPTIISAHMFNQKDQSVNRPSKAVTRKDDLYTAIKAKLNLSGDEWEDMQELMDNQPAIQQVLGYNYQQDQVLSEIPS